MSNAQSQDATPRRPLRLWPGVVIVSLQWLLRFVVPVVDPDAMIYGILAALVAGLAVLVWWVFFSRAPWLERLGAVVLIIVAFVATKPVLDDSISTGAMGMLFPILTIPVLSLAFVVWAVATRHLGDSTRRATMVATIFLAFGGLTLVRTDGFTANFDNDLTWRWTTTPEERMLAQARDEPKPPRRLRLRRRLPRLLPLGEAGRHAGRRSAVSWSSQDGAGELASR